jgi:hypothetical protein
VPNSVNFIDINEISMLADLAYYNSMTHMRSRANSQENFPKFGKSAGAPNWR